MRACSALSQHCRIRLMLGILTLAPGLLLTPALRAAEPASSSATGACTPSEKWRFGEEIPFEFRAELERLFSRGSVPVWGFAQGLALRRAVAVSDEAKAMGEYWISRSLFSSNLIHSAFNGFAVVASRPVSPETIGVQTAAMECLNTIIRAYPAFDIPPGVVGQLGAFLSHTTKNNTQAREAVWELAMRHALAQMAQGATRTEVDPTLEHLKGSGPYEALARGVSHARGGRHDLAIKDLARLVAPDASLPSKFKRYLDTALLITSRSHFALGQYEDAIRVVSRVKKSSNELAKALTELSWHFLKSGKYSEAIGAAMNLQAGGLKKAFAPESQMVMAMALNELCQFPESLKAINTFRKYYEKSYRWLDRWALAKDAARTPLYPELVKYVKKQSVEIPDRVVTDWVRAPLFIANQDQINLLYDESEAGPKLRASGAREQRAIAGEIRGLARELKTRIANARAKVGPDEPLPAPLKIEIKRLRRLLVNYLRLESAAPVFVAIDGNFKRQMPKQKESLIAEIERDLRSRTERMYFKLLDIAENNQLIEVEIYNGASQDLIWQNANPEYAQVAKTLTEQEQQLAASQVYDWGRAPAATGDETMEAEIWEDELGSFKANMYDNCSSKERYLSLKRLSAAQAARAAIQAQTRLQGGK